MNNHMNSIFDKENKRMRYTILKLLGIVSLVVAVIGALGAGVGLALGAFGISVGIPVVGSALVTAGSWLATAIPALGVALPIALGAIAGFGIAFLAISGIRKLIKSFSKSKDFPPNQIDEQKKLHEPPKENKDKDLEINKNIKINKEVAEENKDNNNKEQMPGAQSSQSKKEQNKENADKNLDDNNNIINNINNNNNDINIKNIGIVHNREYQRGTLMLELHDKKGLEQSFEILGKAGYNCYKDS